jgi:hypothetical protein
MGSDSAGNGCCLSSGAGGEPVYALVIYVPGRLCRFLDDLRRDLIPSCNPHAHVSVLPPRTLKVGWETARDGARAVAAQWAPFRIEAGPVGIFPGTDVVYLEIGAGADELRRMHAALNADGFAFAERFSYHPHITLAQSIPPGRVREIQEQAARRWSAYDGERSFPARHAVLVRNSGDDCWTDLAGIPIGGDGAHITDAEAPGTQEVKI